VESGGQENEEGGNAIFKIFSVVGEYKRECGERK
jgi:hypothetical protein